MTPRRHQSSVPAPQPVKIYKIIAVSFLVLAVAIFGVIIVLSAKRATITIETRPEPLLVSGVFAVSGQPADGMFTAMVTSTFAETAQDFITTGSTEEPAIATGTVTLHNTTGTSQPLVATTRLLTPDGVLFRLKQGTVVPANGTVTTEVYADQPGASGNVSSTRFTIPGLSTTRQAVVYATSEQPMSGGTVRVGAVGAKDLEEAIGVVETELQNRAKAHFQAAYPNKQVLVAAIDERVTADAEAGKQVGQFSVSGNATYLGVMYEESAARALGNRLLDERKVGDTELIAPGRDMPTLNLESYDPETGAVKVKLFHSGVATLNPNSQELSKTVFFGKSEEEVRRYVLTLDRVHGVSVDFSPSWVETVPRMSERVKVVVKQVE